MEGGSQQEQAMQRAQMEMEKQEAMREQRKAILGQILTNEAKERLANIAVVKPQKAEQLEMLLIQNAQRGMIQGKVTEGQMIDLLEQVSEKEAKPATSIKFQRKRLGDDDDDLEALGF